MSIATNFEDRPRSTAARKRRKQAAPEASPRLRLRTTAPGLLGLAGDPAASAPSSTPERLSITIPGAKPHANAKAQRLGIKIFAFRPKDRDATPFALSGQPLRARTGSAAAAFGWMLQEAARQGVEGTRLAADAWRDALKQRRTDQAVTAALGLPILLAAADAKTAHRLTTLAGDTISAIPRRDPAALEQVAEALVNTLMANPERTEMLARALRPHRARLRATKVWPYLRAAIT